jgi:hypothetical protein
MQEEKPGQVSSLMLSRKKQIPFVLHYFQEYQIIQILMEYFTSQYLFQLLWILM